MSAPSPALAYVERRIVIVRLADPAVAVASLSTVFGLLLVFLPTWFPQTLAENWQNGHLTPAMILLTVSLDAAIYLRAVHLSSAKPRVLASVFLGCLPIMVVVGLTLLLQAAITHTLLGYFSGVQARVQEEILFHTYCALAAGVFLPFLLIRLIRHSRTTN